MDLRCPICGEPWDMDTIHEEVEGRWPDKPWKIDGKHDQYIYEKMYYKAVYADFRRNGCNALSSYGMVSHNAPTIGAKNSIYGELMDIAGDDVDFAASMIDDAERYGLLD